MSQEEANISGTQYDDCCSLSPGSSKSDEFEAFVARRRMKKKRLRSGMVITSESDDEDYYEEKKTKLCETSSNVKIHRFAEPPSSYINVDEAERLPCLPDDDDGSDLSSPVLDEGDSYDASQCSSNDTELEECAISQHSESDDLGEQSLGESLCQLPSAAEPKPESTDEKLPTEEEPDPVEEKPRKKTAKTKHIELPPDEAERLPCLPDDDDGSDLSSPVLDEGDSYDASQRSSNDTELGECAISQHNVSDDLGEQSLGESLRQLPSAAQPKPKSTHEKLPAEDEPAPVEEKPRKKTAKTKHIELPPDEAERLPCLPDDDDGSDLSSPVLDEGDSYDASQRSSNDTELGECAISQHNVSDDLGEQSLGESLRQLPSAAQPKPKSTHEKLPAEDEPAPVEEKPRKKTAKTKHIELPPVPTGSQKCVPSKKIPSSAKVEKFQTGNSLCKIPGCFLLDLEKSKQYSGKKFQKNKDELVQKIYNLFNSSVFDKKLPKKIDIAWNKKMLKTAGICTTGEIKHPKKQRYAKIEIAQKVCDSADRLRDTLVHEICHVASWLLDGTRDSHGDAWNYYAHKSTMIHPELPKITRYHNYTINYRIHYECIQCKTRIGRYTRSLNTDRFICANCRGSLVLLPLTRKDGTPIEPYVRPFAKYVQENYRLVKQELGGKGHGDVMKKLSKDYIASKQKQGC